jgi:hypothetical protein
MGNDREAWTTWAERHSELPPVQCPPEAKPNKYKATAVHIDGIRFDSLKEGKRYTELNALLAVHEIEDLELHPGFPLMVPRLNTDGPAQVFHTIGMFHADFKYRNVRTGNVVVEDVKSKPTRTEAYLLRKKFVEWQHGIIIVEIT